MTREGGFKRAVRQRARESGQRYTEVRAAMDKGESPDRRERPFDHGALKAHLERRYRMRITSMASRGLPAERLAHEDPVSVLDGAGVMVTEFVDGYPSEDGIPPEVGYELGSFLGRLHALPAAGGAVSREGGSDEHFGGFYVGRPKQDLAAAMSFLVSVEDAVAPEGRDTFQWLRDQVENADDAEGLPEALTHGNYHYWAAVGKPGNLVIVGWAGAGRGPRLPALAWLLRTSAEASAEHVAAAVRGYRKHIQLTDEELDRLAGVFNIKPLWLACLDYRMLVQQGKTPTLDEAIWTSFRPEQGEQLAAQVIAAFRS
jgi:aminoglycoside phosphotransferase (APT) family kinase protein